MHRLIKIKKYIGSILIMFIILSLMNISVNAEDKNEDKMAHQSTVQVNYGYAFPDGSFDVWKSMPAVVINETTLMTVNATKEDFTNQLQERKAGYETLGLNISDIAGEATYVIYDGSGQYKKVTEVLPYTTDIGDFVILKTDEKMANPVKFSPRTSINDQEIYAIGFSKQLMDGNNFAKSDNILQQKVKITSEEDGIIRFSIDSKETFSGSALVNGYGELYGFILSTDNGGAAIDLGMIEGTLDSANIIYDVAPEIVPINFDNLHSISDAAEEYEADEGLYTKETMDKLKEVHKQAEQIELKENVTQKEVDYVTNELVDAINNLEEIPQSSGLGWIKGVIIICLILLVIAGALLVIIKYPDKVNKLLGIQKKKPTNNNHTSVIIDNNTPIEGLDFAAETSGTNISSSQPVPAQTNSENKADHRVKPVQDNSFSNSTNFQGGYIYEDRQTAPKNQEGKAIPSTSVLKEDIQSNDEIIGTPYIIRVASGERYLISHNQFTIGRDYNVDYRIPENIYIGKRHCTFMEANGQWYIIDNKSANKTIVNGAQIPPNTSIPIYDKTEIILANERFVFRYILKEEPNNTTMPETGILAPNSVNPNMYQNQYQNQYQDQGINQQYQSSYTAQSTENYQNGYQNTAGTSNTVPPNNQYADPNGDILQGDPNTNVLTANQIPDNIKIPYLIIGGKKIKIYKFPFSIGRGKNASYKYTNDKNVSREHAIITTSDGRYYIKDNHSANGTYLNMEPLDPGDEYVINDSDIITILKDEIEFHV